MRRGTPSVPTTDADFPDHAERLKRRELVILCASASDQDRATAIAAKFVLPRSDVVAIMAAIAANEKKLRIARRFDVPYESLNFIATCCGRPARRMDLRAPDDRMCGQLTWGKIAELHADDVGHNAIGAMAGVSRERIRQVTVAMNLTSRSQLLAQHRTEVEAARHSTYIVRRGELAARRASERAARVKAFGTYMAKAKKMWAANASIGAIAEAYGERPGSMAWKIHTARRQLGEEWFPRRLPR